MLKDSGVDGAPNILFPLAEKNEFILGLTNNETQILKMVKIRVTGERTFNWLEAKYNERYPEECGRQSTFYEECFEGQSEWQHNYDVDLVAAVVEPKGITQGYF